MKNKIITWVALIAIALVSTASVSQMKKIKYSVKNIDGSWLVVNEQNRPVAIEADKNDDIEWTAEGSDLLFQFPEELSVYFTKEDGTSMGGGYYVSLEDGKKLKLKIKGDAPTGRFIYAVLVKKDGTFAEGSSPPVMIIK
jgi:hypothetical protein